MISFETVITNSHKYRHHALLLISPELGEETIIQNVFSQMAEAFCNIKLSGRPSTSVFDLAKQHGDIFIADRSRKILRIQDVAPLKNLAHFAPVQGNRRLFYIENCERMNASAANAILKILEEPFAQALFILTAQNLSEVLPTIASRCQKVYLSFQSEKKYSVLSEVAEEDLAYLNKQIGNFNSPAGILSCSLADSNTTKLSWHNLKEITEKSEKLGKEYSANLLRDVFIALISQYVKKKPEALPWARFVLSEISEWKNKENFNLSSQFWILRILTGFQL